jgi:uncharacterized membrane protein
MFIIALAFLIGIVSGLRTMTAPAAVSWAARIGILPLQGTPLAFLGYSATPYIFTLIARVISGAFSGAAVGAARQSLVLGLVAGAAGAVAGTLGGAAVRTKLAEIFGKDLPAALLEDAVAIILAIVVVTRLG